MKITPLCSVCDEGFDLSSHDNPLLCDPCETWAHDRCGEWVNINRRDYFFCKVCNDLDG